MAHRFFDYSKLTPAERVELAMELWDSVPDDSAEPPLAEWQRAELVERLDAYRQNPGVGSPWAEVRERVQRKSNDKP